jgi:cytochrome c2
MKLRTTYLAISVALLFFLSGCSGQPSRLPEPVAVSDHNIANGRLLIAGYGCGSCHTIPGVPGADAMVGPSLDRFYERSYIAGRLPNTWTNLIQWIEDPQQVKPGTAMPNLGVKDNEAFDIAAYLYAQPTLGRVGR